jgi:adenylate kinase
MILVLLGPPGAGKGTQAKLLAEAYGIPHVSTGDMFRDHTARGTEIGKRIKAVMNAGGLVTDDITNAMLNDRLGRPDVAGGLILDGYPRTTAQAEHLEHLLEGAGRRIDGVLSYEVPLELLLDRIGGRRSCPKCGAVYHVTSSPPRRPEVCDRDGAALVRRDDDKPENVTKRMQEYDDKTRPLKRFYRDRGVLLDVDATRTPEAILASSRDVLRGRAASSATAARSA